MEALTYLLKVTACTVLFFGFYLLVLRKLTFFKINRFYLLASLLLSFVIPALQFEVKREMVIAEPDVVTKLPEVKTAEEPVQLIQPIMVEYQPEVQQEIDWLSLIPYAYAGIALVLLLVCLGRVLSLLKHIGHYTKNSDGLKLITKTTGFTNCSFFNYVFIDGDKLSDADFAVLLKHEQVHASQYHSADKILLMIAKALLWFNPVIYLYDKALEQVHEYEADEITSASFGNQAYASLLLQLAVTKTNNALIHNFVKSPVKDRIKMLFNQKSKNMKKLCYVLALPILLGLVYGFTVSYVDVPGTNNVENTQLHLDSDGKWVKGVIVQTSKELASSFFTLKTMDETYIISSGFVDVKIEIGDELSVFIVPTIIPPHPIGDADRFKKFENTYMPKAIKNAEGNVIFKYEDYNTWKKSPEYTNLLSEANRIKGKEINGIIEQVHYFGVAKIADGVLLKVGQKRYRVYIEPKIMRTLTLNPGDNLGVIVNKVDVWQDSKYPVIIVEPKKMKVTKVTTEIKEKANQIPLQFVVSINLEDNRKVLKPVKPKIISFSKMSGNVKSKISYLEDAVIVISNSRLEAKNVELDMSNNRMIAKDAVLEKLDGKSYIKANTITFDLKNEDIKMNVVHGAIGELGNDNTHLEKLTSFLARGQNETEAKVSYVAEDSVKMSNDKSIISLYGNAKISYNSSTVKGSKIVYNKLTNTAEISDAVFTSNKDDKIYKAKNLYVDFNTSKPRYSKSGETN